MLPPVLAVRFIPIQNDSVKEATDSIKNSSLWFVKLGRCPFPVAWHSASALFQSRDDAGFQMHTFSKPGTARSGTREPTVNDHRLGADRDEQRRMQPQ
jgi:hypothetical protein